MDMGLIVVAGLVLLVVHHSCQDSRGRSTAESVRYRKAWEVRRNVRCRVPHSGSVYRFHPLPATP